MLRQRTVLRVDDVLLYKVMDCSSSAALLLDAVRRLLFILKILLLRFDELDSSCCAGLLPLTADLMIDSRSSNCLAKIPPVEGRPDFGARCAEFREKVRLIGTYIDGYQPWRDKR